MENLFKEPNINKELGKSEDPLMSTNIQKLRYNEWKGKSIIDAIISHKCGVLHKVPFNLRMCPGQELPIIGIPKKVTPYTHNDLLFYVQLPDNSRITVSEKAYHDHKLAHLGAIIIRQEWLHKELWLFKQERISKILNHVIEDVEPLINFIKVLHKTIGYLWNMSKDERCTQHFAWIQGSTYLKSFLEHLVSRGECDVCRIKKSFEATEKSDR